MIQAITFASICGVACAFGFSWLIQYFRGRYEQEEGTASVVFGGWVGVCVLVIFLDRVSAFHGYPGWLSGGLLAAATIIASVWIACVLRRPVKR